MWNVFRVINILWLFISTYWWITAKFNLGWILIVINAIMIICMSMLPIKVNLNAQLGRVIAYIMLIAIWTVWVDGLGMGLTTILMYLPVLYLLQLPFNYKKDLLEFTTKWYAIFIAISLVVYWFSLFITLPTIGTFEHPPYPPFLNHIFYIETTVEYETIPRFNAFFLEPGHQALLSTFLILANRFNFKECRWLWVLLLAVLFSFSLAGYLLLVAGYCFIKINTLWKALAALIVLAGTTAVAINLSGGDNALNMLIISRLEKDEQQGIKGNNRFYNDTDFVYTRTVKKGDIMTGVKDKTNMELVGGAGYKIYVIHYGLVGVILSLLLYLSLIPPHPDYRYTIAFLVVLALCFLQRSYPTWYSWLFPYVIGIYLAKKDGNYDSWQQKTISE